MVPMEQREQLVMMDQRGPRAAQLVKLVPMEQREQLVMMVPME